MITGQHPLWREIDVARRLITEAGARVAEIYQRTYQVDWKAPGDPITEADRASEEIILAGLRQAFPHDGILSEETTDDRRRLAQRRVWIVDPLDGTRDFVDRTDEFSIMIGLAIDGMPAVGLVYQPVGDRLFVGVPGVGAWMYDSDGEPAPLCVSAVESLSEARLVVSRSHRSPLVGAIAQALGVRQERPCGSVGLKVSLLATQEADIYVHPSLGCKEWDVCAPDAIIRAAGGRMTDCWGRPFRYNLEDVHKRWGLIATNGRFHWRAVGYVAAVCEAAGVDVQKGFA